jgi:tetratricopeptide (TPR) repeat protein
MSVISGFNIVLMLCLLVYMAFRCINKRELLTLISIGAQLFAIVIALLSFINDIEAINLIQACFVTFGIIIPCVFFFYDYRELRRAKNMPLEDKEVIDYNLFFSYGVALSEKGLYEEAVTAFNRAMAIKPEEHEINYHLAAALTQLKQYAKAVEVYKNTLSLKPPDSELYYNIAAVYSILGKYDIARDNLSRAVELNGSIRKKITIDKAFDSMRKKGYLKELIS